MTKKKEISSDNKDTKATTKVEKPKTEVVKAKVIDKETILFCYLKSFTLSRKNISTLISKNTLQDKELIEFYALCELTHDFMIKNKDIIISEKKFRFFHDSKIEKFKIQFDKSFIDIHKHLLWCKQQFDFRNEIKKKAKVDLIDYDTDIKALKVSIETKLLKEVNK